jgi:hypothetical protein
MKLAGMNSMTRAAAILACVLSAVAGADPLGSQEAHTTRPVVELKVLIDGVMPATIGVRAGERATITTRGAATLALVPELVGAGLDLRVARLIPDQTGGEQVIELGRFQLQKGIPETIDVSDVHLEVEWTALDTPTPPADVAPKGPCNQCCVVCEDREVCACRVVTSCGTCCCPYACFCPSSPNPSGTDRSGRVRPVDVLRPR